MSIRGQSSQSSASGAAVLVVIIAAILVLYILFLPPEDRAVLLGEENDSGNWGGQTASGYNKTLLKENIGRLDYLKFDYREHDMPSFRLFSETEGTAVKSINSIYVKNSISSEKFFNMSFEIEDQYSTNVMLSFNVEDSLGRLILKLNGEEIFNGYLDEGSPDPIILPDDLLDDENVLSFEVSGTGMFFWRTNRYQLTNVLVSADVLDVTNSRTSQFFYISSDEKSYLESVKLKYLPSCDISSVGPLKIYLNGNQVFSGVADCGIYNTLYLDKNSVYQDRNELEFVATEGSYLIERLSVRTELEDLIYPVYYFELDEDIFDGNDLDPDFNVTLVIRYANEDDKRMDYSINGHKRHIDTDELIYEAEIDDYVYPGSNSLELIPTNSIVDIAELKVLLGEED